MIIDRLITLSNGLNSCLNRSFSSSATNNGVKNFNKFRLVYRGTEYEKKLQKESPDRTVPNWAKGVRYPGYWIGNRFVLVPEMIPEIVVPDLTACEFKPYVSYRAPEIEQEEFTAEDLFDAVYTEKIVDDFKKNKLDENGNPLEPSDNEKLTAEGAYNLARRTGSDYFSQDNPVPPDHEEHNFVGDHKISSLLLKNDLEHEHEDSVSEPKWNGSSMTNF